MDNKENISDVIAQKQQKLLEEATREEQNKPKPRKKKRGLINGIRRLYGFRMKSHQEVQLLFFY